MDRFSVSLEAYHELSQVNKDLPRTHLIEGCTKKEDSKWEVKRTPGSSHGAEIAFKTLLEREYNEYVST